MLPVSHRARVDAAQTRAYLVDYRLTPGLTLEGKRALQVIASFVKSPTQ